MSEAVVGLDAVWEAATAVVASVETIDTGPSLVPTHDEAAMESLRQALAAAGAGFGEPVVTADAYWEACNERDAAVAALKAKAS